VLRLGAHVADVHVDTGVNVIEQIPAHMVGVLVYDEIIAAIPAPIGTNRPVPGRNFKVEAARQPEAAMIGIEAFDVVTVGWAKVFETTALESMFNGIALIVRPVVPIPVVFVNVWSGIHVTCHMALRFGLGVGIVPPLGRWRKVA